MKPAVNVPQRTIAIRMPWPPSVNGLYATYSGRRLLSSKGRDYHQTVAVLCRQLFGAPEPLSGRLRVVVTAYPPDNRRRDLSNHLKALEDSLTNARVWNDDSQIDDLRIVRAHTVKPGHVHVEVTEIQS